MAEGVTGSGAGAGHLLEQVADRLSDMVLGINLDGSLYYVSPSVEELLGYSGQVFLRLYNQALSFADDRRFNTLQTFIQRQLDVLAAGGEVPAEAETLVVANRDGFRVTLTLQSIASNSEQGSLDGLVCVCRDISSRKHNTEAMALALKVFENSLTAIYITNAQGTIVQANQAFVRLTGYSMDEVIGESPQLMDVDNGSKPYFRIINEQLTRKDFWEGEIPHRRRNGQVFPAWVAISVLRDSNRRVINTITYFTDITEKKNSDSRIHRLAYFDALTGLPNRSLFLDRLDQAVERGRRAGQPVAVLLLDIHQLQGVNDRYGHRVGDALLCQVASRLRDCVRREDTVARLEGDAFSVLLVGLKDQQQAVTATAQIVEKIFQVLERPFDVGDCQLSSEFWGGIAFYPADGREVQTLLHHAEVAQFHAKSSGESRYQFYSRSMGERARERLQQQRDLQKAVDELRHPLPGIDGIRPSDSPPSAQLVEASLPVSAAQFELVYQPIVSLAAGNTTAVEALLRWHHPRQGLLLPADFMPLAEECGLIKALGDWVIRQAAQQWHFWRLQGQPLSCISINVSAAQFDSGHLVTSLSRIVSQWQLPEGALQLEITEQTLMTLGDMGLEWLTAIHSLGVRLSLDNFGAGYSSLRQMKSCPFDSVKVDHSFLQALPSLEDQQAIQAIVALARSLGLKVIAGGVEKPLQLEFVQAQGCDEVQGFLLGQPLAAQQVQWR